VTRDRAVLGWVLYDLANVIFALGVVGLYYPLWIVDDLGGRDRHVAIASSASMLVVFAVAPLLGLYADRAGSRIRPLAICTIVTCGLTMLIGQGGLGWSIAIFIGANIAFGCGLVFYDALLPVVSTPATQGVISGYGVGAGFAGAVVAVVCGLVVLALNENGKPIVFVLLGCLFLVGAIPCFVWVRDGSNHASARRPQQLTIRSALARARAVPGMGRFLVGRILYTDAANTMFAFMSVYAVKEVGFSDFETQLVLLAGIVTGPIGAVKSGKMADTIGAKATLDRLILLDCRSRHLCRDSIAGPPTRALLAGCAPGWHRIWRDRDGGPRIADRFEPGRRNGYVFWLFRDGWALFGHSRSDHVGAHRRCPWVWAASGGPGSGGDGAWLVPDFSRSAPRAARTTRDRTAHPRAADGPGTGAVTRRSATCQTRLMNFRYFPASAMRLG